MRCLIYARVSRDLRGEARSVTEQEAECRAWAYREGWHVVDVITETGSASRYARSTGARSRWGDVTTQLQTRKYDALLVWEASRATRNLTDFTALRDLCANTGVRLGYSGTLYDLTDRSDRFRTGLDALLSEDESARTSERIRRTVRARAAAGQPHGKLPYGYTRTYDPTTRALLSQDPHPDTAPTVRFIYQQAAAGVSTAAIARDLNAQGTPPPRPGRSTRRDPNTWIPSTVGRIIRNPTYNAQRTHKGQIIGPATWPPLVDPDLWDAANATLAARTSHHRGGTLRHLLSGIATCGPCGGYLYAMPNRGYLTYQCTSCFKVARRTTRVDEHVTALLLALIDENRDTLAATQAGPADSPDLAAARAELVDIATQLEQITQQVIARQLTPALAGRMEQGLLPLQRAAQARVRRLQAPTVLAGYDLETLAVDWPALPLEARRDIIADLLTITVWPIGKGRWNAPIADGVRITPTW